MDNNIVKWRTCPARMDYFLMSKIMNKEKLEFSDISCYFPFDLRILDIDDEVYCVTGLEPPFLKCVGGEDNITVSIPVFECRPILRPMCDLHKPLEDGSIPIIRLAEIAFPNHKWTLWQNIAVYMDKIGLIEAKFNYQINENYFMHTFKNGGSVKNLLQLFAYLNKHHFDHSGLVNKNLAVNINVLNHG